MGQPHLPGSGDRLDRHIFLVNGKPSCPRTRLAPGVRTSRRFLRRIGCGRCSSTSCNLARAPALRDCDPDLCPLCSDRVRSSAPQRNVATRQFRLARKHLYSRPLSRWSRTTPTRQGALHDPSRWAPRRRPVDDGRLRRCRERGRNPVLKSGHPRCWRSEECRRITHEAATKSAAMPKAATGKAGSRPDDASRRQHRRKNAFHDRYSSFCVAPRRP